MYSCTTNWALLRLAHQRPRHPPPRPRGDQHEIDPAPRESPPPQQVKAGACAADRSPPSPASTRAPSPGAARRRPPPRNWNWSNRARSRLPPRPPAASTCTRQWRYAEPRLVDAVLASPSARRRPRAPRDEAPPRERPDPPHRPPARRPHPLARAPAPARPGRSRVDESEAAQPCTPDQARQDHGNPPTTRSAHRDRNSGQVSGTVPRNRPENVPESGFAGARVHRAHRGASRRP